MSTADDLEKILTRLSQATVPENENPISATIQLALSEEAGGNWLVEIDDNEIDVKEGKTSAPDLTLGLTAANFVALCRREVSPMELFITGKISVKGDMSLAFQFQNLFNDDNNG